MPVETSDASRAHGGGRSWKTGIAALSLSFFCAYIGLNNASIVLLFVGLFALVSHAEWLDLREEVHRITHIGPIPTLTLLATIGVLVGFDKMSYGYYLVLRLFLCGASLFLLFGAKLTLPDWQRWALGGFAFVYNPVVPIRLGDKGVWEVLNVATAGLFWVIALQRRPLN